MRDRVMRRTMTLGIVSGLALGCGSDARSVVRGQLSSESFNLHDAHVAAVADDGRTWLAPFAADGSFTIEVPKATRLTLRFARPTDRPDVYDAFAVLVTGMEGVGETEWFSVPSGRKRIDLGAVVPRTTRRALTTSAENEGDDDDDGGHGTPEEDDDEGNGSGAGEADDDEGGSSAVEEDDDEGGSGAGEADDDEGGGTPPPDPPPVDPPPVDPQDGGGRNPQVIVFRTLSVCDVQQGADLIEVVAQNPSRLYGEDDADDDALDARCGNRDTPVKASPGIENRDR